MPDPITPAHCLAALDRMAARLDLMHAELEALPPVDPSELEALYAATEEAVANWSPPPGWWW
jgi:hypothetical protein